MMIDIEVKLSPESVDSFTTALNESGVEYSERLDFSTTADLSIQVFGLLKEAAPWGAFAAVLVAWLQNRSKRKINITLKDQTTINIEGFSRKEAEKLLPLAVSIQVLDCGDTEQRSENTHDAV